MLSERTSERHALDIVLPFVLLGCVPPTGHTGWARITVLQGRLAY